MHNASLYRLALSPPLKVAIFGGVCALVGLIEPLRLVAASVYFVGHFFFLISLSGLVTVPLRSQDQTPGRLSQLCFLLLMLAYPILVVAHATGRIQQAPEQTLNIVLLAMCGTFLAGLWGATRALAKLAESRGVGPPALRQTFAQLMCLPLSILHVHRMLRDLVSDERSVSHENI